MDDKLGKRPAKQGRLPVEAGVRTAILPGLPAALFKRSETFLDVGRNNEN